MKIRTKLALLAAVGLIAMATVALLSLRDLRKSLLAERQLKTRHVVETAHGLVAHYHELFKSGAMTEDEARAAAIRAVKALRYEGKEYFWINDMHPKMVMHPFKPELDGKDLSDNKDPNGKRLFVAFVDTVKAQGAGFVFYLWPKPGLSEPVEKVSYVSGFAPWGWVIGSGIYIDDVAAAMWVRGRAALFELGLAALILGASVWSLARHLTGRLRHTVEALDALAAGDLSRSVRDDWRDEIGAMGRALNEATRTLGAVAGELEVVIAASKEGRLDVRGDASRFQGAYAHLVAGTNAVVANLAAPLEVVAASSDGIASAAEELTAVSREVGGNASGTLSQMVVVGAAAEQVSRTAQSLASATEEMAATIKEIAGNAASSAKVASDAVRAAETTQAVVTKLGGSALAIAGVLKVIKTIAGQTNLLALNATIEAARAGEAGKGFAVVANEVKELAKETGKATGDIESSVASIQADTQEAVAAISGITGIIAQIHDMANAIATAVEEQSATTREMGRNVNEAAQGAGEIARNISAVSQRAEGTSAGANQTLSAASELARMAAELKGLVGKLSFGDGAGATPGVADRGHAPRRDKLRLAA